MPVVGEPRELRACQRLAAAVIAQAFHDLEHGTDDQHQRAHYYLTRTFWKEGHLWADLVRHVIVEEQVREKITAAARAWRHGPPRARAPRKFRK